MIDWQSKKLVIDLKSINSLEQRFPSIKAIFLHFAIKIALLLQDTILI